MDVQSAIEEVVKLLQSLNTGEIEDIEISKYGFYNGGGIQTLEININFKDEIELMTKAEVSI